MTYGTSYGAERVHPFASIGRTGTSEAKVEVRDICLNISFMTSFSSFFTHIWKKVQSLLSKKKKKKRSLDISLQHKIKLAINFLKKYFCTWPKKGLGVKWLVYIKNLTL